MPELWVCHLGRVDYGEAAALQERLRDRVRSGELAETMLLLEHPPVYTVGRRTGEADLPLPCVGIEVVATPRGGQLTYHGPGQLVGYPIMRVESVPEFILTMEQAIVAALADAGLEAATRLGHKHVGVWVGERKIASVGMHISQGVSAHGFAVNVENDLAPFTQRRGLRAAGRDDDVARRRGRRRGPGLLPQADGVPVLRGVRAPPAARHAGAAGHRLARGRVMDVGLVIFPTGDGVRPDELALAAEHAGYESLFFTEHTHIPTSRESPYPGGGELPDKYRATHDPFVGLAFAAAATTKLKIGTAVCLVVEHDPIVLAK